MTDQRAVELVTLIRDSARDIRVARMGPLVPKEPDPVSKIMEAVPGGEWRTQAEKDAEVSMWIESLRIMLSE